jgi:hypothetical protein
MKTAKILLFIAGVANALFFLFHLLLGWKIHHLTQVPPNLHSLLEMLNGGGALFILFLAVAPLAFARDVLGTGLGRAVLILGASLYLLRALAEFVVSPRTSPAIVATCVVTGALFVGVLLFSRRPPIAE